MPWQLVRANGVWTLGRFSFDTVEWLLGDDAMTGGIFNDSYAVSGPVASVVPVDYCIPGDPPTPMAILSGLLEILGALETKNSKSK